MFVDPLFPYISKVNSLCIFEIIIIGTKTKKKVDLSYDDTRKHIKIYNIYTVIPPKSIIESVNLKYKYIWQLYTIKKKVISTLITWTEWLPLLKPTILEYLIKCFIFIFIRIKISATQYKKLKMIVVKLFL